MFHSTPSICKGYHSVGLNKSSVERFRRRHLVNHLQTVQRVLESEIESRHVIDKYLKMVDVQ